MSKQQLGTGLGAAAGGLLGNQVGRGTGRVLATAAGAVVGGYVGNRIGKNLDEQDRKRLSDATLKTAETGRSQSVVSPSTGATIRTEPVAAPVARKPTTASQPAPATRAAQAPIVAAASGPVATASDSAGGECGQVVRRPFRFAVATSRRKTFGFARVRMAGRSPMPRRLGLGLLALALATFGTVHAASPTMTVRGRPDVTATMQIPPDACPATIPVQVQSAQESDFSDGGVILGRV